MKLVTHQCPSCGREQQAPKTNVVMHRCPANKRKIVQYQVVKGEENE